ncbi:MAG: TIGR02996 domain-containing protein [Myxococcota bacterium]
MDLATLQQQIQDTPDDWAPWLVLSDWLLERQDPRGQIIALEHQLDTRVLPTRERHALWARLQPLLARRDEWLGELDLPAEATPELRHGFLVGLWVPWHDDLPERLAAWRSARTAQFLASLDLTRSGAGDVAVASLVASPGVAGLRRLRLAMNRLTDRAAAAIAASAPLRDLAELDLSDNEVSATGAAALAGAAWPRLQGIDLGGNPIAEDGVTPLDRAPLRALRNLRLPNAGLRAEAAGRIAENPAFAGVEVLNLQRNMLGDDGGVAIARSAVLRRLRSLDLRRCEVGERTVEALLATDALPALAVVDLRDNFLGQLRASTVAEQLAARGVHAMGA